uniref:Uncharacterized protein n=1 Tax=Meloidogyne hapla TaxID=6305 RepID=A0A1I8BZK6_MELHA
MAFEILIFLFLIINCSISVENENEDSTPLLWIFDDKGLLPKDSVIGTQIQFDGPMRINPLNDQNLFINVFVYEPFLLRKHFNISPPSPLRAGQPFKLILAQSLNQYMDVDYLNLTLQAQLIYSSENERKSSSRLRVERKELQIKLIGEENKNYFENNNSIKLIQNNLLIAKRDEINCNKINPIYAFAVDPFNLNNNSNIGINRGRKLLIGHLNYLIKKIKENKNNNYLIPKFVISEGGEGFFNFEKEERNNSGILIYKGPIGQFPRNYTLKVLLISDDFIDSALIHVLIPGIGSSSPTFQMPFQRIIVNKYGNENSESNDLFTLSAEDSDPDARLIYELGGAECQTISGILMKEEECFQLFSLSPNGTTGQWVLSLVEKEENFEEIEKINYLKDLLTNNNLQKQLGEALLNISVRDEAHPLETSGSTLVLLKFFQQNESQNIDKINENNLLINNLTKKELFNQNLKIKDFTPINSIIYSFGIIPQRKEEKFIYLLSGLKNKYFSIDKENG